MGENTLDNRGQWTGKMDCVAPRRGPMPRRDDANGGGDTTSDDAGGAGPPHFAGLHV